MTAHESDEPTAVLTENEIEQLFMTIRKLRDQGIGIVYISHRLEEIFQIADRVSVLRDGKNVGVCDLHKEDLTVDMLIRMMVGRTLEERFPKEHFERGEEILRVENLSSPGRFENVSFSLYKAEILSMALPSAGSGSSSTRLRRAPAARPPARTQ